MDTASQPLTHNHQPNSPDIRKIGLHQDFWYPIALSKQLKQKKTLARSFAGEPVVLVRGNDDEVFALEDRCAHRQVPLSRGVVNTKYVQCGYHCWTYDKTGKCVNVPYLDKDKQLPNGVRSYPTREAYGMIWIYPGDRTKLEEVVFPDIPTFADENYKTRYLDSQVKCHYSFMHENLMDMNHQFLHRKLMGMIRTVFLEMRDGEDWVECDYTFERAAGKQSFGEKFIIGRMSKKNPGDEKDLMTIRTGYPYQTLQFYTAGSDEPALDLWNVYIPVDAEQRINHTFGMIMIRKPATPGLIHAMWPIITWFTNGIFKEDREIVELEQAAFDNQGGDWNQEIFPIIQKLRNVLITQGEPIESYEKS